jgi:delta8-fatty-acid desaturase
MASAIFLAMFWHQISFFAHDAGHNSITHNLQFDNGIGIFLADFLGGLSIGWWKKSHYVHHIVTNHPIHDPDIQHLPFFAITTKVFKGFFSTYHQKDFVFDKFAQTLVSYQHFLYYPVMMFGRFNLYVQSMLFLITEPNYPYRKQEMLGLLAYWIWWPIFIYQLPSLTMMIAYVLVSHMFTFVLHVQITLSHFGMSTEELGNAESFAGKMLRTTMDVDCPIWLDWFHGGLQFQAIHHLFPRMPRHSLRAAQPYVKEFCEEVGLTYHIHGFAKGNKIVISALKDVADQVGFFLEVAKHEAKEYVDSQKLPLSDARKEL